MMNNNKLIGQSRLKGFTLIELMVVITIAAILVGIALPSFRSMLTSTRLSSEANGLVGDIRRARSEAASRGVRVVLCPTTDSGVTCSTSASDWKVGRMVFVDSDNSETRATTETVVTKTAALGAATVVTVTGFAFVPLTFSPYGGLFQNTSPAAGGSFKLCDPSISIGRLVSVGANGKPTASQTTCP